MRIPFVGPLPNLLNLFQCDKCGDWATVSGFPSIIPHTGHTRESSSLFNTEEMTSCSGTITWKGFVGEE